MYTTRRPRPGRDRQALHEHRIEYCEHRDGHPDADRENGDGGDGEGRCAAEAAEREPNVLLNAVDQSSERR